MKTLDCYTLLPLGWQHWNNVQNENQNALAVLFVLCDVAKILRSMRWQDLVMQFELTQLTLDAWQEVTNVVNVLVVVWQDIVVTELQLMFKLMDRVPEGIAPMLKDLEEHIVSAGLADMVASADIITQVTF